MEKYRTQCRRGESKLWLRKQKRWPKDTVTAAMSRWGAKRANLVKYLVPRTSRPSILFSIFFVFALEFQSQLFIPRVQYRGAAKSLLTPSNLPFCNQHNPSAPWWPQASFRHGARHVLHPTWCCLPWNSNENLSKRMKSSHGILAQVSSGKIVTFLARIDAPLIWTDCEFPLRLQICLPRPVHAIKTVESEFWANMQNP